MEGGRAQPATQKSSGPGGYTPLVSSKAINKLRPAYLGETGLRDGLLS